MSLSPQLKVKVFFLFFVFAVHTLKVQKFNSAQGG